MTPESTTREEVDTNASTTDLVREAIEEAKELARLEVALARNEAVTELKSLRVSAVAFGLAGALGLTGGTLLLVALALAIGGAIPALVIGGGLVVIAGGLAYAGKALLPKKPLVQTKRRLEEDVNQLKERVA